MRVTVKKEKVELAVQRGAGLGVYGSIFASGPLTGFPWRLIERAVLSVQVTVFVFVGSDRSSCVGNGREIGLTRRASGTRSRSAPDFANLDGQFSWDNPPQRVARDLLRPLLLNRFSVTALEAVVRRAEQQGTPAPAAIIHRIGSYHERQGYQEASRWLAKEQT